MSAPQQTLSPHLNRLLDELGEIDPRAQSWLRFRIDSNLIKPDLAPAEASAQIESALRDRWASRIERLGGFCFLLLGIIYLLNQWITHGEPAATLLLWALGALYGLGLFCIAFASDAKTALARAQARKLIQRAGP